MKKNLPLILVGLGVVVVIIAGVLVAKRMINNKSSDNTQEQDTVVPDIPIDKRPTVSLVPTDDGHWLNFKVDKISVDGAATMDYLLVYSVQNGGQQGVPGTITLDGNSLEKKLLLGSESSGKFRYDVGVENGTLTLTFRNSKKKAVGRITSDFHFQTGVTTLTSTDGSFIYELSKPAKGVYFVTMNSFGQPTDPNLVIYKDGFSIFSSDGKPHESK